MIKECIFLIAMTWILHVIHEDSLKAGQLMDHLDGRVTVTGEYLEETMANLTEISENLKLLSSQLRRQPWRLVYRGRTKK